MNPSEKFKALSSTTFAPTTTSTSAEPEITTTSVVPVTTTPQPELTTTPLPFCLVTKLINTCRVCLTRETYYEEKEKYNELVASFNTKKLCNEAASAYAGCEDLPECVFVKIAAGDGITENPYSASNNESFESCCDDVKKIQSTDRVNFNLKSLYDSVLKSMQEIKRITAIRQNLQLKWDKELSNKIGKELYDIFKKIPISLYFGFLYEKNDDGSYNPVDYSIAIKEIKNKQGKYDSAISKLEDKLFKAILAKDYEKEENILSELEATITMSQHFKNLNVVIKTLGKEEYEGNLFNHEFSISFNKIDEEIKFYTDRINDTNDLIDKYTNRYLIAKLYCQLGKNEGIDKQEKLNIISNYMQKNLKKDKSNALLLGKFLTNAKFLNVQINEIIDQNKIKRK
jgi:hypothetical protein